MFCGALSLEAALELVDARHDALKGVSAKAVSVVGDADVEDGLVDASKHGEIAVSHDLCPGVRVVSGSRDAVAAFEVPGAVLTETDARQGAHSPLAADAAAAYDALLVRALAGAATLAHPLHVAAPAGGVATDAAAAGDALRGSLGRPVAWRAAMERLLAAGATHFADAGGGAQLRAFGERPRCGAGTWLSADAHGFLSLLKSFFEFAEVVFVGVGVHDDALSELEWTYDTWSLDDAHASNRESAARRGRRGAPPTPAAPPPRRRVAAARARRGGSGAAGPAGRPRGARVARTTPRSRCARGGSAERARGARRPTPSSRLAGDAWARPAPSRSAPATTSAPRGRRRAFLRLALAFAAAPRAHVGSARRRPAALADAGRDLRAARPARNVTRGWSAVPRGGRDATTLATLTARRGAGTGILTASTASSRGQRLISRRLGVARWRPGE